MVAIKPKIDWGYDGDGAPEHWAELDPANYLCAVGKSQSPINITDWIPVELVPIQFDYHSAPLAVENNGHTIMVKSDQCSGIAYNGKRYALQQFHFHAPSEHTIDGESFPMELHIVHYNPSIDTFAVIGIMLTVGAENAAYEDVFHHMPTHAGEIDVCRKLSVNAADLLPDDITHYYTYAGSLTTPPCTENVLWLVLSTPIEVSEEQLATFTALYDHNNRPVQPLNTRDLFGNIDT